MSERNYFVTCENNCKFPAMTKEQVLAAIAQAVETGSIQDVDTGFVTKIKEQNAGAPLKMWVGTQAEYNAIAEKEENCFYIISDDKTAAAYDEIIERLQSEIKALETIVAQQGEKMRQQQETINKGGLPWNVEDDRKQISPEYEDDDILYFVSQKSVNYNYTSSNPFKATSPFAAKAIHYGTIKINFPIIFFSSTENSATSAFVNVYVNGEIAAQTAVIEAELTAETKKTATATIDVEKGDAITFELVAYHTAENAPSRTVAMRNVAIYANYDTPHTYMSKKLAY